MLKLEKGKRNIVQLLQLAAKEYSNDRYVSRKTDKGWKSYSFSEVKKMVDFLAIHLLDLGFGPNQNFAILSEGSPMWVISEYAILSIKGTSVPLSVKLLPEEIPYRLNHANVQGIFTTKNHLTKVLSILDQIENRDMKIIYMDEDSKYFETEMEKAGVSSERGVLFWDALLKGEMKAVDLLPRLNEIIEDIDENDVVNISYTSGTTGNPKGIMLTHLNYYTNAKDGIEMFRLKKNFRTLVILPVDHSFAHTVALYGALYIALDLFFLDTRGGTTNALKNIPINLKEVKPQFLLTVPALSGNFISKMKDGVKDKGDFVNGIFERGLLAGTKRTGDGFTIPGIGVQIRNWASYFLASKLVFSKLKDVFGGQLEFMVGGGALLDIKQQQFYHAIGTPIFQGYGLTEAAPIISANTPYRYKLGTSGSVLPSVTCKIMRNDQEECDANEIGEIVIQGDNVMKGYYKNPVASDLALREGWLWTGDLGYMDEDDFLVVTGRNKALLISEDGEKYSPEGIEEAIVNSSDIFSHVMLYNDHRKFTTAIVSIDPAKRAVLRKYSEKEQYDFVKDQFSAYLNDTSYKKIFPEKWLPKLFFVAPEPFSEDNQMVNSTLKMVRYKITEHYQSEIELMYSSNASSKVDTLNQNNLK
jgi:long-chain acyl-CoA synthetase